MTKYFPGKTNANLKNWCIRLRLRKDETSKVVDSSPTCKFDISETLHEFTDETSRPGGSSLLEAIFTIGENDGPHASTLFESLFAGDESDNYLWNHKQQ